MKTIQIFITIISLTLSLSLYAQESPVNKMVLENGKTGQQPVVTSKHQAAPLVITLSNGKTISREEALKSGALQFVNGQYIYCPNGSINPARKVIEPATKIASNTSSDGTTILKTVTVQAPVPAEINKNE